MQTNSLKRAHPNTKRMIVARGGKRGKTSGRGGKGQTARAGNKRRPEWRELIKKLPKLRGRGRNSNLSVKDNFQKPVAVNIFAMEEVFSANDAVTPATLVEKGVLTTWSGRIPMVKILGSGALTKALKVSGCAVSESAKASIEKAGGTVELRAGAVAYEAKKTSVNAARVAKDVKAAATAKADAAKPAKKSPAPKK